MKLAVQSPEKIKPAVAVVDTTVTGGEKITAYFSIRAGLRHFSYNEEEYTYTGYYNPEDALVSGTGSTYFNDTDDTVSYLEYWGGYKYDRPAGSEISYDDVKKMAYDSYQLVYSGQITGAGVKYISYDGMSFDDYHISYARSYFYSYNKIEHYK